MPASKKEQRGGVRFLAVEGDEGHEMHQRMIAVYVAKRLVHRAFSPQVRGSSSDWARLTQPFIPSESR
ncbi:hypothetical protein TNCV_5065091 [Trichonephila clavipes]|nr:hypothetical protein TNCV_5065091 [Trichonephila clavipes]